MATRKYVSLTKLSTFLDNLRSLFATKTEVDKKSEVQIVTLGETESVTENISTLKIHKLTKEQYDKKLESGSIDANALYLTPDEEIDLTPYATIEQINAKSNIGHAHEIADVNNLQASLDEVKSYADTVAVSVKNELLNGAGDAYDTLKELGELIDENTDTLDALEIIANNKADSSHIHDDIYYTESEIDSKVATINDSIADAKLFASAEDVKTLESSKTYTDSAVAQKSQVQIITWEADD